jgi:hypothetical protein
MEKRRIAVTIKVDLSPETEARLVAQARAQGLPLEKVAERLLKEALTELPLSRGQLSVEEFHGMLTAISEGSEKLPNLRTESFSRESFYEDRLDGRDAVSPR